MAKFQFNTDWIDAINILPIEDRASIYCSISMYVNSGEVNNNLSIPAKAVFLIIKSQMDSDQEQARLQTQFTEQKLLEQEEQIRQKERSKSARRAAEARWGINASNAGNANSNASNAGNANSNASNAGNANSNASNAGNANSIKCISAHSGAYLDNSAEKEKNKETNKEISPIPPKEITKETKKEIYKEKNKKENPTEQNSQEQDNNLPSNAPENDPNPLPPSPDEQDERKPTKKAFNFKSALLELGVSEQVASDWLQVRTRKRASNTQTAFTLTKNEIAKSGKSADDCIRFSVERSYSGFKADWLQNELSQSTNNKASPNRPQGNRKFYNDSVQEYDNEI